LKFSRTLLPALVSASCLLTGCASVSVGNIHPKGTPPKSLPERIYVREFIAPYDVFRVNRGGGQLLDFVKAERRALALSLVAQLSKHVAPAEILPEDKPYPRGNFWVLEGVYDRVDQGSRALRIGIGFGAGGTKMETRAVFSSLSSGKPAPFLSLLTTGGSGVSPGAWAAFTPAGAFFIQGPWPMPGGPRSGDSRWIATGRLEKSRPPSRNIVSSNTSSPSGTPVGRSGSGRCLPSRDRISR